MTYYSSANSPTAATWYRVRPAADDPRTPAFWFAVMVLGSLSLVCVTFGVAHALAKKAGGQPLQATLILPKLKGSDEPSELVHPADQHHVDQSHGRGLESVPLATREPHPVSAEIHLHPIPSAEPTPPALVDACNEPVVFVQPCSPQRGDSPMIHTWKTLTFYSMLSAATVSFVAQPVLAGDDNKKLVEDVNKLTTSIQELTKRITSLENKKFPTVDQEAVSDIKADLKKLETSLARSFQTIGEDIKALAKSVETLQTDQLKHKGQLDTQKVQLEIQKGQLDQLADEIRNLRKKTVVVESPGPDKASLDDLRAGMKALQDAVAKLTPVERRDSMSMPNGISANKGRVMLVNLYTRDVLFTINGRDYVVGPRSQRSIENFPAGRVSYEVFVAPFGTLDRQSTILANGETFTLTAAQ